MNDIQQSSEGLSGWFAWKSPKEVVCVSDPVTFFDTLRRIEENDEELTGVQFCGYLGHFFLIDSVIETFVDLLRSSTHLKKLILPVGLYCGLSKAGISILSEYIETSGLQTLGFEGDLSASSAYHVGLLVKAASRNHNLTELRFRSVLVRSSTLLEVVRSCRVLSVSSCEVDKDSDGSSDLHSCSLEVLSIHAGGLSLVAWLLPRVATCLKELTVRNKLFPTTEIISCVSELLRSTKDLQSFHFNACEDPQSSSRKIQERVAVTSDHFTEMLEALTQNETIEKISLFLPSWCGNRENYSLVETHIRNNPNLVDLGTLKVPGLSPELQEELMAVVKSNREVLEHLETSIDDPPALWPHQIERGLKSSRGRDAIYRRLCMQLIMVR